MFFHRDRLSNDKAADRGAASSPRSLVADPLDDGVFAPPQSLASARKSSQAAAFGALGSRSDVRDEISSTGDFDLPWRALETTRMRGRECVRAYVFTLVREREHILLREPGSPLGYV